MKDSQKSRKKQKQNRNAKRSVQKENPSQHSFLNIPITVSSAHILEIGKKYFSWIVVGITIVNLLITLMIVVLIGKISEGTASKMYHHISVPELPVIPSNTEVNLSAKSILVYEPDSRAVVYHRQGNLRFAPASATKIMTALVSLESYNLNHYLTANGVSNVQGSKMWLVEGERINVESLLYGLMLPSGNDAAYVLASQYPGGMKAFVQKMNEKAQELKLTNTHFVDPAGLDDRNYTTAFDLARLAVFALQNPKFREIVETKHKVVYDQTFTNIHELENLNRLLNKEGIFGVKTGYTEEAGQVLVTALHSKGKTYIVVVLKSDDRFADTEKILHEIIAKIRFEKM